MRDDPHPVDPKSHSHSAQLDRPVALDPDLMLALQLLHGALRDEARVPECIDDGADPAILAGS